MVRVLKFFWTREKVAPEPLDSEKKCQTEMKYPVSDKKTLWFGEERGRFYPFSSQLSEDFFLSFEVKFEFERFGYTHHANATGSSFFLTKR